MNESVKLMEKSRNGSSKALSTPYCVKSPCGSGICLSSREKEPALFLSVMYSYPLWLAEKYIREYGMDFAEEMLSYKKRGGGYLRAAQCPEGDGGAMGNQADGRGFAFCKGVEPGGLVYPQHIGGRSAGAL